VRDRYYSAMRWYYTKFDLPKPTGYSLVASSLKCNMKKTLETQTA